MRTLLPGDGAGGVVMIRAGEGFQTRMVTLASGRSGWESEQSL